MFARRRTSKLVIVFLFALFPARSFAGLWPFSGCKADQQQLESQIAREHNPVKKSKCQADLARMILDQGIDAYNQNDFRKGDKLLGEYVAAVGKAWTMLKSSGRNAVKHPQGFKNLDLALRENGRLLSGLEQKVPYFQGKTVRAVEKQSKAIHDQVLDALFPGLRLVNSAKKPGQPSSARNATASRSPE